jgi:hypothetical protein
MKMRRPARARTPAMGRPPASKHHPRIKTLGVSTEPAPGSSIHERKLDTGVVA